MRNAALSDVHGNLLSGAVRPRETADRLMQLDLPTVAGNHERQLLTYDRARMGYSDRLTHDAIDDTHRAWLAGLPPTLQPADGALAFHGSPTDDLVYLLETVDPEGARPATEAEVLERLGGAADVPLLLCGHTHLQRSVRLPTGALVVNPGSVGWPAYDDDHPHPHVMAAGTPYARYAIVDDTGGRWAVEFRAVDYDWDPAAADAEANGRPDVAGQLRTGRA
ncbi:MAG: hypothetical protein AVDCRST_MAG52-1224 [uncultured Blastococcus sp.]|uniref:Uncharacterized protein n=1 Tax=uncultured Blastococcus sp. TaxID=217144 RepID=A0A6J4HV13_9ACTN|nr:MAG: hypothetical protein AVDCRST_MAG52-1224 [uncultured Blastococcus sp.]